MGEQGHIQTVASGNQSGLCDITPSEKEALVENYNSLQDSAVVQMLLEICIHDNTVSIHDNTVTMTTQYVSMTTQ